MKIKRIVSLFLVLVLALSAVAVLGSCKKEEKKTDNITVQIGPNPETLDPALNSAVDGGNMLITLFETLLIIDQDNKVQPGQAESYTVSPDGLTWTFTMRDGLKWSDGTELNAKDFEYTMKRIADPAVAAPYGETVVGMIEGYQDAIGNPDKDGKQKTPCIIHRTSIGCYERTLALLIEKYAGAFPLWLAPVQVKLLPIADRHLDYLYEVKKQLEDKGFRCEVDDRSEKIGYKIREAQLEKVPYMVVVGDKDIENNTISIRKRKEGDLGAMTVEQFLEKIVPDRDNKVID